jgi:hypothetical protein
MRRDPVFIFGDARSGTTYLSNLLIQHPQIAIAPESNFALYAYPFFRDRSLHNPRQINQLLDRLYQEPKFSDLNLPRAELETLIQANLPLTYARLLEIILQTCCCKLFGDREIWGIKKPGYVDLLNPLIQAFPNAKFINIVRDGRSVFNSKRKARHSHTGKPFETNVIRAAKQWQRVTRSFDRFHAKYPHQSLEIRYETLIETLPETLTTLFHFLDLELSEDAIAKAQTGVDSSWVPSRYDRIHQNVNKPPQRDRIFSWQQELSTAEIHAYEQIAAPQLILKNYTLQYPKTAHPNLFQHLARWWKMQVN